MSDFPTIGSACNITTGKLDSNHAVEGGKYPFFTCSALPSSIDTYAYDSDVILVAGNNAKGNFHVNRYNGKFNAYQRTYVLTEKHGYYLDYIYYSLKLELKRLKERAQGSQTKFLTMPILTNIALQNIGYSDQKNIATVLANIDKKIEINHRINAELEAMAKTLYDYWFVQFDFPFDFAQGKPDPNGKPYKSSGGKMVYNETLKREIPEGWEVVSVGNVLKAIKKTKKVLSKDILIEGDIPVIDQSTDFICGYTNEQDSLIKGSETPHIIFGDHTRILKFVNFDFARGADGTQVLVSNTPRLPQHLFFQAISMIDLSNYGYARHFKFLKQAYIVLPVKQIADEYDKISKSCYGKVKLKQLENQQLTQLRDWLLPMLMNGQVRVTDKPCSASSAN